MMVSILVDSLAKTIASAASFLFLDATLTRDVPGVSSDPADPVAPTQATYTCKAIEEEYAPGLIGAGLVDRTDAQLLILAQTLAVEPRPLDRISIRAKSYTVVPEGTAGMRAVTSDPARATWLCRCRR